MPGGDGQTPRLISINGPPGIGKSTLARRYLDDHPGVLNLDIDCLRGLIGGWQDRFVETGTIVRPLAIRLAEAHLESGRDVVMPQYLGRLDEIERFEAAAQRSGADFCELILMDSKDNSIERFQRRDEDDDPWHRQVKAIVEEGGGLTLLATMHDRLNEVIRARPHAVVVPSVYGSAEETYRAMLAAIGREQL